MNSHSIANLGLAWLAATLLVGSNLTAQAQTGPKVVATGTGRTTGHIATLTVTNPGQQPLDYEIAPAYIPSDGKYQPYVVANPIRQTIPPQSTARVPVIGYCADIHRPPVPDGQPLPPVNVWVPAGQLPKLETIQTSPDGPYRPRPTPSRPATLVATYPGTDRPLPFALDVDAHPKLAAPLLAAAAQAAETSYDQLADEGRISTPFASNPKRQREAVVQQTLWIFAADLEGEPYTREDFANRMQTQLESNTGKPLAAAPPPVKAQFEQGVDDFWNSFSLVGVEAKILANTPATTDETTPPAVPVEVDAGCTAGEKLDHTPKMVDVKIADSYGDAETRQAIVDGLRGSLEAGEGGYLLDTPPATAYAVWGRDHVGGNASAYAKTIFLEKNGQDWVWSTDPMTVAASGTGTHTLAYTRSPDCTAVVAGVALVWLKASSNAFDPLEKSIEVFRALDTVKELSVKFATRKLPPGISDAIEAGVEAITDPSSDTYAAASGKATLTVGTQSKTATATNRVVYKRQGKEDKAIVGGGAKVVKLFVTDVQPDSLTSTLAATATMEAGAKGNGLAKATLESLYGTILVGVCECDGNITFDVVTDAGLFIRSQTAKEQAELAIGDMQKVADAIAKDIGDGKLDTDPEALKKRLAEDLHKWAEENGGERFKD